jgi:mono/diheme cytochrome c family protein
MWREVARAAIVVAVLVSSACDKNVGEPEQTPAGDVTHGQVVRGQSVYDLRCAPCHGTNGGGDGPAAVAITPKPRNFRDPAFWNGRTAEQLSLVVKHGKPGTLMPPFEGVLSDAEIADVVAYLKHFRAAGS